MYKIVLKIGFKDGSMTLYKKWWKLWIPQQFTIGYLVEKEAYEAKDHYNVSDDNFIVKSDKVK